MSEVVDQDDRRYRVRRQRQSAIVIAVVLLGLGGAFYYASTYFRDTAPKPTPCTTAAPVVPLQPADVSLNVYNSTSRRGLAAAVAKTATQRGFKVKAVGNDPVKATITQAAQIRFGSRGSRVGAAGQEPRATGRARRRQAGGRHHRPRGGPGMEELRQGAGPSGPHPDAAPVPVGDAGELTRT